MTERYELILRIPGLDQASATKLGETLARLASRLPGASLSEIRREHYADGTALHKARRKLV
jgi:hypothetical protein